MFAFTKTDSFSHFESVNRVEERRTTVFLLDLLHCGLSLEEQMLLLLTEFVACAIRGYTVVGLVHLDIRFSNGSGISVRNEHASMPQHAMRSLDLGCVGWRLQANSIVFLRVLFRRWVHTNPTLKAELSLLQWQEARTGQQAFWTVMKNIMSDHFSRLGLARELMLPLSFDTVGVKFGFVNQQESHRFAALHDSIRQTVVANLPAQGSSPQPSTSAAAMRVPPAPTFRPIAPKPPTVAAPAAIITPVARSVASMQSAHPLLASLLVRPPVAPADLGPPPPPPQRASNPNNTSTYDGAVVDVPAFLRAAEEVGREMIAARSRPTQAADSSTGRMLTPPPPPPPRQMPNAGLTRQIKAEPPNDGYPEPVQQQSPPPPAVTVKQEPDETAGELPAGTNIPSPQPGPSGLAMEQRKRKLHGFEEEEPEDGPEVKSRKL